MKRRRTWWFAAALLGAVAVAWSFASSSSGTGDVQLRFLHYTNNTDGLDSDALAVFQKPEFLPPALPPVTHAVLQLTNGTRAPLLLYTVWVREVDSGPSRVPERTFDTIFVGSRGLYRQLDPGEAVTLELKTAPTHGSWLAEARFLRLSRARAMYLRMNRYLPRNLMSWVGKRFFAIENATLEFGNDTTVNQTKPSP